MLRPFISKFKKSFPLALVSIYLIFLFAQPSYSFSTINKCAANPACYAAIGGTTSTAAKNAIVTTAKTSLRDRVLRQGLINYTGKTVTGAVTRQGGITVSGLIGKATPLLVIGGLLHGFEFQQQDVDALQDVAALRYGSANSTNPATLTGWLTPSHQTHRSFLNPRPSSYSPRDILSEGIDCRESGLGNRGTAASYLFSDIVWIPSPACPSPSSLDFDDLTEQEKQAAIDMLTDDEVMDAVSFGQIDLVPDVNEVLTFDNPLFDEFGNPIDSWDLNTGKDEQKVPVEDTGITTTTTTTQNDDGTTTESTTTNRTCTSRYQNTQPFTDTITNAFSNKFPIDFIGDFSSIEQPEFCFSLTFYGVTENYCFITTVMSRIINVLVFVYSYNLVTRLA